MFELPIRYGSRSINYLLYLVAIVIRAFSTRDKKGRVLLLRPDAIGDLVLFSASLPAYRELFSDKHIVMVVMDSSYNLVERCPWVDEVWALPRSSFRMNPVERWRWCKRLAVSRFEIAINAVYSSDYRHLDCLIGWTSAPRMIAHECLDKTQPRSHCFPYFTELVPTNEEWKFEIDRNFDLLRHLGYSGAVNHRTEIWINDTDRRDASGLQQSFGGSPYAILVPGSRDEKRIWDAENFVAAVLKIQERFPVEWVIDGGADERDRCAFIADRLRASTVNAHNTAGRWTIRELASVIEGAAVLLANETGPLHIAAAVGTPAVCVLSGGFYGRFYPYPANSLTLALTHKIPCYNCYMNCILDEEECLTKISVSDVADAVAGVLASRIGFKPVIS